jgi:hypothetical protein
MLNVCFSEKKQNVKFERNFLFGNKTNQIAIFHFKKVANFNSKMLHMISENK